MTAIYRFNAVAEDNTDMEESSNHWHYADALRQQHGPLPADELRTRFERGELERTTLVWRTGMAGWQPLESCAEALGIALEATPATLTELPPTASSVIPGEDVVYAGLWRRVAASILDSFVTTALTYVLLIPLMLIFGMSLGMLAGHTDTAAPGLLIPYMALLYGLGLLLPAVYFGWMQASGYQASLGKLAVGIKVVRGNGGPIGFWRGFLRYVAYALLTALTCGIGGVVTAFMAGLTQRKQAPHDFFCDTLVVDRWAYTDQPQRQQRKLDTVTIVVLALYALLALVAGAAILIAVVIASKQA
jgi:uncharacterized RDD family membrane protein YckC